MKQLLCRNNTLILFIYFIVTQNVLVYLEKKKAEIFHPCLCSIIAMHLKFKGKKEFVNFKI